MKCYGFKKKRFVEKKSVKVGIELIKCEIFFIRENWRSNGLKRIFRGFIKGILVVVNY